MRTLLFSLGLMVWLVSPACAEDWPQWLGPKRDSVWRETGIVKSFPAAGLPVKWRVPVSYGYSGPAVAQGKVFVADFVNTAGELANNPGVRVKLPGKERVLCFDAATGAELWKHEDELVYELSYPGGPRCTPTVDGDKLYMLGAEGLLTCLKVKDGSVVWQKNLKAEYKVAAPIWGFTSHPLVDGDLLFTLVGGEGSIAVAFDKHTGAEVWRALSAPEPGYCPPTMIEHAGVKQLLIWHTQSLNSLNPRTGKVYWSIPLEPSYSMSVTAPRKEEDYLYASGIGNTSALLKLAGDKPGAQVVWRGNPKNSVFCANSTPFLDAGMIYGADCQTGQFIGAQMKDGKRLWETFQPTTGGQRRASHGTAFIVKQDDRYFLFSETGDLILAQLSPAGYEELGRFHVLEPTNESFGRSVVWSHPAFAKKCVFARNDKELVCVDLADGE
jgi:outer membrane protein assembly factor BamB